MTTKNGRNARRNVEEELGPERGPALTLPQNTGELSARGQMKDLRIVTHTGVQVRPEGT